MNNRARGTGARGTGTCEEISLGDGVSRFCDLASCLCDSLAVFVLLFYGSVMRQVSH